MKPAVEEATVRIGVITAIPAVLRSLGADPAKVLAEAGFDPEFFADPENLISYKARGRVLNLCATRTGCRHFGLLVGQQGRLSSFGLVGFMVQNSPDVGTALHSLVRYLHLHVRGAAPSLDVSGNLALLGYHIYQSQTEGTDQIGDGAVAVMFNILSALCGPDWTPIEARFAHRKPEDTGPFREFLRAPLRFDAEQYGILFSTDWFARPLPAADAELRRLLRRQIDALEARFSNDFVNQVRSVLRTALLTGNGNSEQVAALFSIHSRTLHRRLTAFGTSFHALADESRFEIARQMLQDSSMQANQIAITLNYSDASAFTRAFRRWTGTTPAAWRMKHRTESSNARQSSLRTRSIKD